MEECSFRLPTSYRVSQSCIEFVYQKLIGLKDAEPNRLYTADEVVEMADRKYERWQIQRALKALAESGLLEYMHKYRDVKVELTDKGKETAQELVIPLVTMINEKKPYDTIPLDKPSLWEKAIMRYDAAMRLDYNPK